MHSGHMLRESTWSDHVRVNMGHANIDVTQIVYGESAECVVKFSCKD